MNQRNSDQLNKVLALADSSHDGEAMVAVRKAREILSRDGLSFGALARAASNARARVNPFSIFSGSSLHLEVDIAQLRQKLDDVQTELEAQNLQLEHWRARAAELEQKVNVNRAEAERWRQLARDTVEKLWDLGQSVETEGLTRGALTAATLLSGTRSR